MRKERYILIYDEDELDYFITDTEEQFSEDIHSWNLLCDLLNEQDTKIKELLRKLRVSNSQLASSKLGYNLLKDDYKKQEDLLNRYLKNCSELNLENQQLKQSQNQKAIEVLTYILVNLCSKYTTIFGDYGEPIRVLDIEQISDFINNQIKELGGKKE